MNTVFGKFRVAMAALLILFNSHPMDCQEGIVVPFSIVPATPILVWDMSRMDALDNGVVLV